MRIRLSPWSAGLLAAVLFVAACVQDPVRNGSANDPLRGGPAARAGPGRPGSEPGQRLALVIGNGAYKDSPLLNAANDARSIGQRLSEIGFKVTKLEDASLKEMNAAVRDFGDGLRKGGVGLFYYAGHGIQIRGRNFLVPVDADIKREDEVSYNSLDANSILDKMESAGNGTNIMILDACRNNPFARSFRSSATGLAQMDAPVGTYISFATAPGRVASDGAGANGLFTQHLLNSMRQPGLKIEDVFKRTRVAVMADSAQQQVPWDNSSLTGDFYFLPAGAAAASAPAQEPAAATDKPAAKPQTVAEHKPGPKPAAPQSTRRESTSEKSTRLAMGSIPKPSAPPPASKPMQSGGDEQFQKAQEAAKKGDARGAADLYEQAAQRGHAGAQFELGMLYKIGRRPITQDLPKARTLLGKAAPNNTAAAYEYGMLLDQGQGGDKNCREAQRWLQRAAEGGMVGAMTALGDSLLRSCNGEKKPEAAAKWLRSAADKSSVAAQFSLGILYFNGDGVAKNPGEARKWLELAESKGHPSARFYLDRLK
jgi:TPR repeat protein